jgi:hypothetical protein
MMISLGTNFYPGVYDTYNMRMEKLFACVALIVFFVAFLLIRKKGTLFDTKDDLTFDEVIAFFSSVLVMLALIVGSLYFRVSENNTLPQVEGTIASIGETTQSHGRDSLFDKETEVTLDDGTKFSVLSTIDEEDFSLPAGTRALFKCDGNKLESVNKCIFVKKVER